MRTRECIPTRLAAWAFLAVLLFAATASAQTLSLMAPSLANVQGRLTALFGVTVEEKPILKGELEDGGVLVLRCEVVLSEPNAYWFDQTISEVDFESVLRFDPLTREFTMTLPGRETPLRNADLPKLLREGWETIEVGLGSWALLDRGRKYRLTLRTSMHQQDAPQGLLRFIYFWSWEAGADNSFQLDFTF